ncbi:hypothetical protein GIB67_000035 [Kingdonia uniflora]|uniref:Pentatricopeptide repeat-containing protein n=1 Tax=Kingdonia uniflora TaxID=39325 RepID=A0A7J7MP49_9MAGN|nr:hypothetical protein GIB67_000035 [Kingdonia uniflora]
MYSKLGDTGNARKVFDGMPDKNVVPWSAIIGCYSRWGDVGMALSMYNRMRHEGVQPNLVSLLGLLGGVFELDTVECIHAFIVRSGFEKDLVLTNSLLNVYGRCGRADVAWKLFKSMNHKDIVSWNSLFASYAHNVDVTHVFELLKKMMNEGENPNHQTFGSVLSAVANESKLEIGMMVHGMIVKAGFELDVHVDTNLIVMYLKCGNIDAAFRLFDQSTEKDVISWTSMITGLVQNDRASKALRVFQCMLKTGMEPVSTTIASAIAACAQLGSLDMGSSIHGYIVRHKIQVDTAVQNSLVSMYSKCGNLDRSWVVFNGIRNKDVVTWNALVAGYAQDGYLWKALVLFNDMKVSQERPDFITVVSLLQACASHGALHQGKWLHNFVIRNRVGPCISIDTALVDMYSKCGEIDIARKCFKDMPEQDIVSWSTIIAGYGCHGRGEMALRMYDEFLKSGIEPNNVLFLSVLCACSHSGLVHEGMDIFRTMTEEFGVEPRIKHRACIVDLLSRAGRLEEAYNFVKRMFLRPTIEVMGILLSACRAYGKADLRDLRETITREILSLCPDNAGDAGNYVQLAHSYALMNKWDGMGETLMQIRSLGLKKVPGWSSVEIHGNVTTFFVDHPSHPEYEELMLTLKLLGKEMCVDEANLQHSYPHEIT